MSWNVYDVVCNRFTGTVGQVESKVTVELRPLAYLSIRMSSHNNSRRF
jgi:hypothetical protein